MISNLPDGIIRDFSSYLAQLGYSAGTVSMLPACVKDFLAHQAIITVQGITSEHIQNFYEHLQQRPRKRKGGALSEQYINHHVYALKVFFNWLEQTGQVSYNPMSVLKFKQPQANSREPLTREEVATLFDSCTTPGETTLLHLFYSCGLRRSEGEALRIGDVHFKEQLLYIRSGKGAKRRVIPLPADVSASLESYVLNERVKHPHARAHDAFMLNKTGGRMRGERYNRLLKTILERSGLRGAITLHHLRHSIATHLLENGVRIEFVRDFLGHSHLEATQLYARVGQSQLKKL